MVLDASQRLQLSEITDAFERANLLVVHVYLCAVVYLGLLDDNAEPVHQIAAEIGIGEYFIAYRTHEIFVDDDVVIIYPIPVTITDALFA